ncbi:MAG TPA: iron-containing redox enzyme family protein [Thermoanaerobaculia bacterium]|nr:iron-containing redox enzyme family protein [Thermoanaerobaculia bacterium]
MKAGTDLVETLLAAARPAPIETHPFVVSLREGALSPEAVRGYAIAIARIGGAFPYRIASVLAICDHPDIRRSLISNLLEEEGVTGYTPGEHVRVDPKRRHGEMGRKFARAAGATDAEVDALSLRHARWFGEAIGRGDWLGAFAYFAIGQEANVPSTFRLILDPLMEHYGFSREDLEFLTEHFEADERHGLESAHLIARVAETSEARQRALEGARRGGMAWWALHRTHTAVRLAMSDER